jgi:hypothetical protein
MQKDRQTRHLAGRKKREDDNVGEEGWKALAMNDPSQHMGTGDTFLSEKNDPRKAFHTGHWMAKISTGSETFFSMCFPILADVK